MLLTVVLILTEWNFLRVSFDVAAHTESLCSDREQCICLQNPPGGIIITS